jgi:hypothetical protein
MPRAIDAERLTRLRRAFDCGSRVGEAARFAGVHRGSVARYFARWGRQARRRRATFPNLRGSVTNLPRYAGPDMIGKAAR